MAMKLWWEEVVDYAEACKDLEYLAYNGAGLGIAFDLYETVDKDWDAMTAPVSEQLWAMREGLA